MKLTFKYKSKLGLRGVMPVPIINVTFTNPKSNQSIDVDCLIDSGADDTVVNASLAEFLGIDLADGEQHFYQGISNEPTPAYDHKLLIQIENDKHKFEINAAFMPGLKTACLLGRNRLFDNFKVVFEQHKDQFELSPVVERAYSGT